MNVLLVEDEVHVRRALSRSLAAWGHAVIEADTASDAQTALWADDFDLIVLDINLPDATGWDVLRGKALSDNRDTPAIVISAISPSVSRLREFHPFGVLHKPFPIDSLHQLVNKAEAQRSHSVARQGELDD
jgi:DNA-binding response OmpR family regulator